MVCAAFNEFMISICVVVLYVRGLPGVQCRAAAAASSCRGGDGESASSGGGRNGRPRRGREHAAAAACVSHIDHPFWIFGCFSRY
uniref:Secreted protein n=1 Tax=Oryza rufipogon TaxID=4529 RepID=A0A0E0N3W9_ORYRU